MEKVHTEELQRLLDYDLDGVKDIDKLRMTAKDMQHELCQSEQRCRTSHCPAPLAHDQNWALAECELDERDREPGCFGFGECKVLAYDDNGYSKNVLSVRRLSEIKGRSAIFYPLTSRWKNEVHVYVEHNVEDTGFPYSRARVVSTITKPENLDLLVTIRVKRANRMKILFGQVHWLCILLPNSGTGKEKRL